MGAAGSHGFVGRFLGLHFEFLLASSSEVKGWRRFMIADAWASFVRPGGRGADEREKGTRGPWTMSPRTCGKRQADRSDVRQEFARKRARTGFEPLDKRTGASPSCRECLTNPCLLMLPFRFAHAMRMRPLSVGRLDSAFHPATDHYREVQTFCKENATKSFSILHRSGPGTAPALRVGHWVKRQSPAPSRRPLRVAAVRERRSGKPRRANTGPFADGLANLSVCHPSHERLKTRRSGNSCYGTFPRPGGYGPGAPVSAAMRSLRTAGSARRGGRTSECDKGRRWTPCSSKRRLRC